MAISKKSYVLIGDGKAVVDDGKQTGIILVGAGGTIDDDVAKQYGVLTDKSAPAPDAPNPSGQSADQAAAAAAAQSAAASASSTGGLTPAPTG